MTEKNHMMNFGNDELHELIMGVLTPKEIQFCESFCQYLDHEKAADEAGYDNPAEEGLRLVESKKIQRKLMSLLKKKRKSQEMSEEVVINNLMKISEVCSEVYISDTGNARLVDAGAALKANELLGKTRAMFTEKSEQTVEHTISVADQIKQAIAERKKSQLESKPNKGKVIDHE